jgi:hypothetical protein
MKAYMRLDLAQRQICDYGPNNEEWYCEGTNQRTHKIKVKQSSDRARTRRYIARSHRPARVQSVLGLSRREAMDDVDVDEERKGRTQ